jgi:hypothetical protein
MDAASMVLLGKRVASPFANGEQSNPLSLRERVRERG